MSFQAEGTMDDTAIPGVTGVLQVQEDIRDLEVNNSGDVAAVADKYINLALLRQYDLIVNMTFSSEEEAFEFFKDYAKIKGFSVRKSIIRKDKTKTTIVFRQFYCSRHGFRERKHLDKPNRKRPSPSITRCGCPVKFCVKLDPKTGRWWVQNFIDNHNHDLANTYSALFLQSHCSTNQAQKSEFPLHHNGGAFKDFEHFQRYLELTKISNIVCYEAAKPTANYLKLMKSLKEELQQYVHENKLAEVKQDVPYDIVSLMRIGSPKPAVTMGSLKKNNQTSEGIKSAIEGRRKNNCGHCGQRGHNQRTCQLLRQDAAADSIEGLVQEDRDNICGPQRDNNTVLKIEINKEDGDTGLTNNAVCPDAP